VGVRQARGFTRAEPDDDLGLDRTWGRIPHHEGDPHETLPFVGRARCTWDRAVLASQLPDADGSMIKRRVILLLIAVAGCGFIVGCGSSGASSTGSTVGTSAGGTNGSSSNNPAVAQAVATCKSRINSQGSLSASLKSKLNALCDRAGNGDLAGAKQITAQVCREIVQATVPKLGRGAALAACKKLA
jgi:hypothetical protein